MGNWEGLEMLQVEPFPAAKDDIGVENAVGVNQAFEEPHEFVCLFAPLCADERSHVPSGSVLCLEGAAITEDQGHNFLHECGVAFGILRSS